VRHYDSRVAQPASRIPPTPDDESLVDPTPFIELRYRYHRAKRSRTVRRREESRLAHYRFYIVLSVLVALAIAFLVGSWHEIHHLFGI